MDDSYTIVATREIAAPVADVWDAWNAPEKIARWWGPAGFRSTVKELDVRQGGRFDVTMHGPDGTDYHNVYVFDSVEPYRQLVYTNVGSAEFGLAAFQSVFDMVGTGDTTQVTLEARFTTEEDRRKHVEDFQAVEGSRQLLERLEEQARSTI
ncbi:SRPBCC domain-containing protein [Micromonospora fiedleri]|uniref:SRPBCC domain-containing protein n=1 Tax=Micromonospora fiedleri TaxID=1157498 RepID=A0ABS1UER3_9ACTN|nr:SRPBCC domain-containing protein [Micromonospora fiedleri]MBL6274832.1 SRPBCC domain-containing protein [Micromonospora fiedleri]